jgi:murein DD-endopeptidase MepM/ murein hydrolase activator NlpD
MNDKWIWPLPGTDLIIPVENASFGAVRKFDMHTGCDIYCEPGQEVVAVEEGEIVLIENFTGADANPSSPWWHETQAVLIEGHSGVVVYGEIEPLESLKVGQKIQQGEVVGHVVTVLKKDKGLPMTMLHIELYKPGTRSTATWGLNESQPEALLNPTAKLIFLK